MQLRNPARLTVVFTAALGVAGSIVANMVTGGDLVPVRSAWWPVLIVVFAVTVGVATESSADGQVPSRPAGSPDHTGAERDVFLCYAQVDGEKASKLYDQLVEAGIRPWMASRDIGPGQTWQLEIKLALRRSRIVVILLSSRAVRHTGYVQKEIREALDLADLRPPGEVFIIPALLGDCEVPDRLEDLQWVDLTKPGGRRRLITAILRDAGKEPASTSPVPEGRSSWFSWRLWALRLSGALRRPALWLMTVLALIGWIIVALLVDPAGTGSANSSSGAASKVKCNEDAFPVEPGERITVMRCSGRYAVIQTSGDVNVKGTESYVYQATPDGWKLAATGTTTHGALSCGDLEGAGLPANEIVQMFPSFPFVCP